jgi:hypothetical protein
MIFDSDHNQALKTLIVTHWPQVCAGVVQTQQALVAQQRQARA